MMNVFKNLMGKLACVSMLVASPALHAEDIDLFVGSSVTAGDLPNVLFVIDNTANWSQSATDPNDPTISSAWDFEKKALARIFRELEDNRVNVGLLAV